MARKQNYTPEERRAVAAKKARETTARLRAEACSRLGNRCASSTCLWVNEDGTKGCTDSRCLQIDHPNGDGAKERRTFLKNSITVYLKKVIENPQDYQLLCANCNWIKRVNNKEHGGATPYSSRRKRRKQKNLVTQL